MNWFTSEYVGHRSTAAKSKLVAEWGGCEHVLEDEEKLHTVTYENDPWGREGYCFCEECIEKVQAAEDNEEVVCYDCKQTFKRSDTISWKWYDFYAPQGDEPLVVCKACQTADKHRNRVRRDREDYEAEFPEE